MAAPSKTFSAPTDSQIDPNSPVDTTLMTQLRDNDVHLEEWMGKNYTAAVDHDHDGVNSKIVPGTVTNGDSHDHSGGDGAVIPQGGIGASAVGQGELKTALQQSTIGGTGQGDFNFTGGAYTLGWGMGGNGQSVAAHSTAGYVWGIRAQGTAGPSYFQTRYLTASEPYNLGNGDIPLFVFAVIDSSGNIVMSDVAEAPPWFYNGRPENTFNPKKYKMKKGKNNYFYDRPLPLPDKATDFAAYLEAVNNPVYEEIEITPAMKNLDMDIIPHPFIGNDLTGKTVVLLDPVGSMAEKMRDLYDMGESVSDLLTGRYLLIDNEIAGANSPAGVKTHKIKWRK